MTLQTWMNEFYPVPASEVLEKDAPAHSLRKWKGLLKENLEKHDCITNFNGDVLGHGGKIEISEATCALCLLYRFVGNLCSACPLAVSRGRSCFLPTSDEDYFSPWRAWLYERNPLPMINVLEKAIKNKETIL